MVEDFKHQTRCAAKTLQRCTAREPASQKLVI